MNKHKLIISACLLGIKCRYDGKDNLISEDNISRLKDKFELIPICPEQLGGLSTPRLPAEIQIDGKILRQDGVDISMEFQRGADEAFKISNLFECNLALLKAKSPSCGNHEIYDGSFTGKLIPGKGITAKLFEKHGIKVYNENEIKILIKENKDV
jgi:uncharacterized protein YbbK (DUF523 family)